MPGVCVNAVFFEDKEHLVPVLERPTSGERTVSPQAVITQHGAWFHRGRGVVGRGGSSLVRLGREAFRSGWIVGVFLQRRAQQQGAGVGRCPGAEGRRGVGPRGPCD